MRGQQRLGLLLLVPAQLALYHLCSIAGSGWQHQQETPGSCLFVTTVYTLCTGPPLNPAYASLPLSTMLLVASRGQGTEGLRQFYAKHFIPKMPSDVVITPIERNVGVDAKGGETVVDEFLFSFTHTTRMDWMLPGVPPTGKKGRLFCCSCVMLTCGTC